MNDDKFTDAEIDALDGSDLLELGKKFLDDGDGQRALKCFLRAGELGYNYGYLMSAEIFADGSGEIPADGYKALEIYDKILRGDDGTKAGVSDLLLRKIFGEEIDDLSISDYWQYPHESYLEALYGKAAIFRYGSGGVPVNGRKAVNCYKKIITLIFDTLDIDSLDPDKKFKRILAGSVLDNFAVKAFVQLGDIYGYGEANIRPDLDKSEKFYEAAVYIDHGYVADKNYRSWSRKNDERTTD